MKTRTIECINEKCGWEEEIDESEAIETEEWAATHPDAETIELPICPLCGEPMRIKLEIEKMSKKEVVEGRLNGRKGENMKSLEKQIENEIKKQEQIKVIEELDKAVEKWSRRWRNE